MRMRLRDSHFHIKILRDLNILDKEQILTNKTIRYGEKEILWLFDRFFLSYDQAVRGMRNYIDDPSTLPTHLKPLQTCIVPIPCSSAECERGFSLLNIIETDLRTPLLATNISSLMFLNINGPPISMFECTPHILLWKLHHRTAIETQSRILKPKKVDETKHALWTICNS